MSNNIYLVISLRVFRFLLPVLIISVLSGCSTMQAISMIKGGDPMQMGSDVVVSASKKAHLLTVKVRLNGKAKEYTFAVDTGALTLISEDVARELTLGEPVKVDANDSAGNEKEVSLVQLDQVSVGDVTVNDCAAVVVDVDFFGKKIDGLLGSNFLKYFVVQLNYQSHKLKFLANPYHSNTASTITIPFYKNMKYGFSPTGECQIDGDISLDCMFDTGHPDIVTVPISSFKNLPQWKTQKVIESKGSMGGGAFGDDSKSYLTKINTLTVGNLEISDVPVTANKFTEEIMTIGVGLLSKYLVTIDYPESILYLDPLPDSHLIKAYKSFGFSIDKKKDTVLIKGIWNGSSAQAEGLSIGDTLLSIDSKNLNNLSFLEIADIVQNTDKIELSLISINNNAPKIVTLKKNDLLKTF